MAADFSRRRNPGKAKVPRGRSRRNRAREVGKEKDKGTGEGGGKVGKVESGKKHEREFLEIVGAKESREQKERLTGLD